MEVPAGVSRLFRTTATVGPSFYIAITSAWRYGVSLLSTIGSKVGLTEDDDAAAAAAVVREQTAMAVRMFELDRTFEECLEKLPDSDPREQLDPGERQSHLAIARLIAAGIVSDHYETAAALPPEVARRSQHAKTHGCVHAKFIVDHALTGDLATGAFQPGASYDAVLRVSNANGSARPDRKGDGRGMAIKLKSTDGSDIQDFVLVNFPVFFVDDVPEYQRFMAIIHARSSNLLMALRLVGFFVPWRLRKGLIFLRLFFLTIEDPFDATYHSMSPFALGSSLVVRYIVTPVQRSAANGSTDGAAEERPNFLRSRMRRRLASPGNGIVLDFSVQIRDRATLQDVEQASRRWRRAADRIVHIARIEVPAQDFATADRFCTCEDMTFSPWHCLPEHRPLGGLNRSRLLAYLVSSRVRRRLNMVDRK